PTAGAKPSLLVLPIIPPTTPDGRCRVGAARPRRLRRLSNNVSTDKEQSHALDALICQVWPVPGTGRQSGLRGRTRKPIGFRPPPLVSSGSFRLPGAA